MLTTKIKEDLRIDNLPLGLKDDLIALAKQNHFNSLSPFINSELKKFVNKGVVQENENKYINLISILINSIEQSNEIINVVIKK